MSERSRANWVVGATMAVAILVPAATVTGVLIGSRGSDPGDARPAAASVRQAPGNEPATKLEAAPVDSSADMTQLHHSMLDQMRASLSSSMNELMNRDPMWQMMRSTNYIAEFEQHEQDIDRMLARGGG